MQFRGTRGWVTVGFLLVGLALFGVWLLPRATNAPLEQESSELQAAPDDPLDSMPPSRAPASLSMPNPPGADAAAAAPPALLIEGARAVTPEASLWRDRVLDSMRRQQRQEAASGTPAPSAAPPAPGTMKDLTGALGAETMRVINHEFLPLVDECYDRAREHNPRLRGMLALAVNLAGAEDVGGIVESIEAGPHNQVSDPELIECVRQSAFSIQLPPPSETGRNGAFMTIPLGIELDGGR